MPKQKTDHLIQLILRLTSSEKRHFKLFAGRKQDANDTLYIQLFDFLSKEKTYQPPKILRSIPGIKLHQLPNLKANLYHQLLTSLRHVDRKNRADISLRENLDFSKVLYRKGMYKAALDLLDRSKKMAIQQSQYATALGLIEFEKHIESQHITGSMYPKAEALTTQTEMLLEKITTTNKLSNLSLSLYGFYLQYGYVKSPKDFEFIKHYFKTELKNIDQSNLDFYQRLYLNQSYVWYYNMIQDFASTYKYAIRWVKLFHEFSSMIHWEPALYLKGLHNVLNSLFMLERLDRFEPLYDELLVFEQEHHKSMKENEKSLWVLFKYIHGINHIFLSARYNSGVHFLSGLEKVLQQNTYNWDLHRKLVFYYKIACVYFGNSQPEKAITFLNLITNQIYPNFREDIQCFARILSVIAHYDLGNTELVSYQIKSVYRFLLRMNELQEVLAEILRFLRKLPGIHESELKSEFIKLKDRLENLEIKPYARRPFRYLDIISWLESKIENKSIQQIIIAKKVSLNPKMIT